MPMNASNSTATTQIFSNAYTIAQSWSTNGAVIKVYNTDGADIGFDLLCQRVAIQYQRKINPMFPVNTNPSGDLEKINLVGAPTGTLTLVGLLGPTTTLTTLFEEAGAACTDGIRITIQPFLKTCDGTSSTSTLYELNGCILEGIQIDLQGNEVAVLTQPLTFSFTSMKTNLGHNSGSIIGPSVDYTANSQYAYA